MKLHPDWNDNGSVAITFDDDEDDASETYSDFSRLLNMFNINFTTFKLRGSKTASMVIPLSFLKENYTSKDNCDDENIISGLCDTRNDEDEHDNVPINEHSNEQLSEHTVIKKKKKRIIN